MTLIDYLTIAAARGPGRLAVADDRRELTYHELNRASDTLAAALQRHGAGPGERVGILLPAGVDAVVALWAVLKTGAAYVPLDPATPPARRQMLLSRVAPVALVTDMRLGDATVAVVAPAAAYGPAERTRLPELSPDAPAYLLHTSGSTGVPKGVMLSHGNAVAFVDWAVAAFDLSPADRVAGLAPLWFDLSILDVFAVAAAGAALLPVPVATRALPAELAQFLHVGRVTVLYCVPTALTMLTRAASAAQLTTLRAVLFAGEVCPPATVRALWQLAPGVRVANLYGPTETNVCTWHELERRDADLPELPIGRPAAGARLRVVTAGREAADGEVGELRVAGPTVASGYWRDPDHTAERFTADSGGPWYRTGDVVVRDTTGVLWFRGRLDRQVKTRGHRVELEEVEAALSALPEVAAASVVAVEDDMIGRRLLAAVVPQGDATAAGVRRAAAGRLPRHAVPAIHLVDTLPRTATGKADHSAVAAQLSACQPVAASVPTLAGRR